MPDAKSITFSVSSPAPILVEMHVSRVVRHLGEGTADVWGHVGDYEVCLCLPAMDGRVKALVHQHKLGEQLRAAHS